ncbi:MAG: hypothetical protein J6Z30_02115 [Pyramidobacter sp.]|nr:hypothetical protein [Pyramidobacter sp.]
MNARTIAFALAAFISLPALALTPDQVMRMKREIAQADYHLKEFENEVARQRGGQKMTWRSKQDALLRVQTLKKNYPDEPEVEKLFQRARVALMKSKGEYTEVDPAWTVYKANEENLRKIIAAAGQKAWDALIAQHRGEIIEKAFPAPDSAEVSLSDLKDKYVVLDEVQYPAHQFYGATSEYVAEGKPSQGYWFIDIAKRQWLGPYEAVKRYRRNVDSSMQDVTKWKLLGRITDLAAEIPEAGENKVGSLQFGWVVTPVALMVPDHVTAWYDKDGEATGTYAGEDQVAAIKDGWYTVKEIPADVTPERLMEIFMTAIKEKNFKLYQDCIDPERRKTEAAEDLVRYHWDLHQERFHNEYVHATFGKAKISVIKGFDEGNSLENFFLDQKQQDTLKKIEGQKVEEAVVESRALTETGKQLGSPVEHRLVRRGGGRWYVVDYAPRF